MALTNENNTLNAQAIVNALAQGDANAVAQSIIENIIKANNEIQNRILEEAKSFNVDNADAGILAKRGFAPLTSDEIKYYNAVQDAGSFDGLPMPKTIFDRVFEELEQEHALLSEINFVNTTGVTEWITKTGDVPAAWWGALTDAIKKKLDTAFKVIPTTLTKVSAYIPVAKAMLDLGPVWLDRYARAVLVEAIALAAEEAIVAGDGKDKPVGMIYQLDNVVAGAHVIKAATELKDLKPATIGSKILAPLSHGKATAPKRVILVVNPETYYEKIYAKLTVVDQYGVYHKNELPFDGRIIQSAAVPKNRLVVGDPRKYFFGIGSDLKMTHSDEFRLLDDQRVYVAKQYATGMPASDGDFLFFDISSFGTEGI